MRIHSYEIVLSCILLLWYVVFSTDTCFELSNTECAACNCNTQGSVSQTCNSKEECTCKNKFYGIKCKNRNCEMNHLSDWTTCRCGYADRKTRTRSVQTTPVGKGKACPNKNETGTCTMVPCNCAKIKPGYHGNRCEDRHCELHQWSSWGGCDRCQNLGSCSINSRACLAKIYYPNRHRSRGVKTTRAGGGRACSSNRRESKKCAHMCTPRFVHDHNSYPN